MTDSAAIRGRGAVSNPAGRFETRRCTAAEEIGPAAPETVVRAERVRKIVSRNRSPDIPFEQSINPYRGCEHGCVYCYARPTHAWLNLSPGLDFETRLFYKENAVEALERELSRPGYRCTPVTLGANTDPYQPVERRLEITRKLLRTLSDCRHPVSIVTKGSLIERDIDLLAPMAAAGLCAVSLSVTTLDDELKRIMEPRAAAPQRRLSTMRRLSSAGIPVSLLLAPVIPAINDAEIEAIVAASACAGATAAGYVLLRLPHELADMFEEWLNAHFAARAAKVMSLVRQTRNGRTYDSRFGVRQRGTGPVAALIGQRFERACGRAGLGRGHRQSLDVSRFRPPSGPQMSLY